VGELLPELDGKEKVLRRAFYPVLGKARVRGPVERTVYLYRIEELAVILQLVYLSGRVEITFPGAFSLGVRPTGCANVDIHNSINLGTT